LIYKAFLAFQPFQLPASRLALPLTAFSLRARLCPCLALALPLPYSRASDFSDFPDFRQGKRKKKAEGKRKKDCESEKKI